MAVFIKLVMMSTIPLRSDLQVRFFEAFVKSILNKSNVFQVGWLKNLMSFLDEKFISIDGY